MPQRVLLIAYHYPPVQGSSGIQRTLKFSQYLPDFAWQPSVLTANLRAYEKTDGAQLAEVPSHITVKRAFALDTARHLAVRGIYPELLALPDRWVSWCAGGVLAGLQLIRRERPALLWSTYPIASAHLIGLALHRISGLPWIADCRDSMTEDDYPPEQRRWQAYRWIERHMVRRAAKVVFTTPGALRLYAERYPEIPKARWHVIANGYDEENFTGAERRVKAATTAHASLLTLVHSGSLYPSERDPRPFFTALAKLKTAGAISAADLRIILRASGHDAQHRPFIEGQNIQDIVRLEPDLPYQAALQEMLEADGLLLFQAATCNHQIPAKAYEYLRARRPIFALTDCNGDTAKLLLEAGIDGIVPLDDAERIASGLERFLGQVRRGAVKLLAADQVAKFSRYERTCELAALFDEVAAG